MAHVHVYVSHCTRHTHINYVCFSLQCDGIICVHVYLTLHTHICIAALPESFVWNHESAWGGGRGQPTRIPGPVSTGVHTRASACK